MQARLVMENPHRHLQRPKSLGTVPTYCSDILTILPPRERQSARNQQTTRPTPADPGALHPTPPPSAITCGIQTIVPKYHMQHSLHCVCCMASLLTSTRCQPCVPRVRMPRYGPRIPFATALTLLLVTDSVVIKHEFETVNIDVHNMERHA